MGLERLLEFSPRTFYAVAVVVLGSLAIFGDVESFTFWRLATSVVAVTAVSSVLSRLLALELGVLVGLTSVVALYLVLGLVPEVVDRILMLAMMVDAARELIPKE